MFESLDDADVRTAGTTYLIYRGRHQHEVANESALARIVTSTLFRRTIDGPQELFYADLYASSRKTGCRGQLGMPGDRATSTPAASAPTWSSTTCSTSCCSRCPTTTPTRTSNGPHAQVTSIAAADRQLERLMHAAGGPDEFLDAARGDRLPPTTPRRAVEERIRLDLAFAEFDVATPERRALGRRRGRAQPGAALGDDLRARPRPARRARARDRVEAVAELEGVDLVHVAGRTERDEAVVRSRRGELRFAPGGELERRARRALERRGRPRRAAGRGPGRPLPEHRVPRRAGARSGRRCNCPTAGDVLLSAAPGYEFVDWGGADHVGGG